jgi:hypothetical protein
MHRTPSEKKEQKWPRLPADAFVYLLVGPLFSVEAVRAAWRTGLQASVNASLIFASVVCFARAIVGFKTWIA